MRRLLESILGGSGDINQAQRVLATFPAENKIFVSSNYGNLSDMTGDRAYVSVFARDFNAALKGTEENQYVLRLEPKGELGGFSEVLVGVGRSTSDIDWVSVRDAAANVTTIRFSAMRKGVGVQESLFRFQVPDGVDIVELGQ